MRALKSFFTWLLSSIFPPRASARLVHEAYVAHTELKVFSNPEVIKIQRYSSSSEPLQITPLIPYRLPLIPACVLEAKFHNNKEAQEMLGNLLAGFLNNYIKVSAVLVPIPLGKKRRKERGYNQIEEISRFAVKNMTGEAISFQISLESKLLVRSRETNPQMTLGRTARLANMKDAFVASQPLNPETTYILIDDVVTTGATLLAAYEALQKGGATRILVVALAH